MKFHIRITELRKRRNYTQQQVADYLGISRGAYANYEIGNREPDADTLAKLAELYDTTTDYILGLTDDPTPPRKDAAEQQATLGEIDDPELGLWFKELLDAPAERREELRKIWEIIKQREAGRKPGDKQGE